MKKSKKALLWTIVPVLGVSSGVAGAVAGTKDQTTSVGTNNVATPATATTMNARATSNLKIDSQSRDVQSLSGEQNTVYVRVSGASVKVKYEWLVNKGDKWSLYARGQGTPALMVTSPKTSEVVDWTFKCKITDLVTGETITSEDIKFTTLPSDCRYVKVANQPEANKTVNGGETVTLTTNASLVGTKFSGKTIGYQWFEYDSSSNKFNEIKDATNNTYTFTAPYFTTQKTKKYVCRYYIVNDNKTRTYLNESNQSIITINKTAKEQVTFKNLKSSLDSMNVGQKTSLSVEAESTISNDLKYQWFKLESDGLTFKEIDGANTQTYEYEAKSEDAGKELTFMVRATGVVQDGLQNYFESNNLKVKVNTSDQVTGSSANETFKNSLSVTSSVTTSQASVRSTFYAIGGVVKTPEYTVNVKNATGLTYKWYYVSSNGKETLIQNSSSNVLKTNKNLYEAAYKDNSKHKVGIKCEIYNGNDLVHTVDSKTNSSFYMTVVITRK